LFLELENNVSALIAVDILNNREFDKKHILTACISEDQELLEQFAYQNVEHFPKHEAEDITSESKYLMSWIKSGSVKSQFNIIKEDKTITEITKIVPENDVDIISIK